VTRTLEQLALREPSVVRDVRVGAGDPADWPRWLEELGFIPGEPVTVLARGVPGGDPLVVRVGESTFALRRAEARCVVVDAAGSAA
jgi:ferrous iron transport protein A